MTFDIMSFLILMYFYEGDKAFTLKFREHCRDFAPEIQVNLKFHVWKWINNSAIQAANLSSRHVNCCAVKPVIYYIYKYRCIEKFNNLFTITDTLTPLYTISLFLFEYRYSVENAYLEEKEDTCNALGEISENSG